MFSEPIRSRSKFFTLLARKTGNTMARIGIIVAKRHVKRALDRNRIRRLIRESFRYHQASLTGLDIVVLIKGNILDILKRDLLNRELNKRESSNRELNNQELNDRGSSNRELNEQKLSDRQSSSNRGYRQSINRELSICLASHWEELIRLSKRFKRESNSAPRNAS